MITRSYTELSQIDDFAERYEYLALHGHVADPTFGFDRYINQQFYRSREWRRLRQEIILRDNGCDMGIEGYEIFDKIMIHHMNPMRACDIVEGDDSILDPEYLISVSHQTHNAIHYGDSRQLPRLLEPRRTGDTLLWNRRL